MSLVTRSTQTFACSSFSSNHARRKERSGSSRAELVECRDIQDRREAVFAVLFAAYGFRNAYCDLAAFQILGTDEQAL